MIKYFKVKNFAGFKDEIVFDFSNTRTYAFNNELVKNKIVNKAMLYGKNGSGKTNIGLALFDIVCALTDNFAARLLAMPNYVNFQSHNKLVEFEYKFEFEDQVITYQYGKMNQTNFVYENLYLNSKLIMKIDLRNKSDGVIMSIKNAKKTNIDAYKNLFNQNIYNYYNLSLLKYIYSNNVWDENDPIYKLFDFVNRMLWFRKLTDGNEFIGYSKVGYNIEQVIIDSGNLQNFQEFLKSNGLEYNLIEGQQGVQKYIGVNYNGKVIPLIYVMSSGTKYLELFYCWSLQFDNVSFLYLDEFDANYHYETAEEILKLVQSKTNMQSVVTTHNTYLMKNSFTRPDCCFIIFDNKITNLSDCTDKEIREAHNLEKMYINGAFTE